MSGVLQLSGSVASKSIISHGPRTPGAVLSTPEKVQVKCPQSDQEALWQPQKIAYCSPIKATMLSAQSPRPYSWWWNSHHSPKNSKWLQENLTDMDDKVRAMLKLIEEDADSFAKRAEMYYKKRPELVKLVEEFYRAYRALVERYDHISGELRQVHYIIAEALPNQTQGDFPYTSLLAWTNEQSFESPRKTKSFINADIMPKSSFRQQVASPVEMHSKAVFSPNGTDDASEMSKSQGLKQLNEIITQYKTLEKKVLQLQEDLNHVEEEKRKMKEGSSSPFKQINSLKEQLFFLKKQNKELDKEGQVLRLKLQGENVEKHNLRTEIQNLEVGLQNSKQGSVEKGIQCEDVSLEKGTRDDEISSYQDELYQLQKENNRLSALVMRGVQQLEEVEEETRNLYQDLSKSRAEQETLFLQYENSINLFQTSENRAKDLQVGVALLQEENNKLKDELTAGALHLKVMEEKAHNLERDKKAVQEEMEHIIQKTNSLIEELTCVRNEEQNLRTRLQDETSESRKIDIALKNCQKALHQSQEQHKILTAEIQVASERVKDGDRKISVLEGEISQLENQIGSMVEQIASASMTIKNLEEEVSKLKQEKSDLLNEVAFRVDQRNALQQELYCLQEERNDLDRRFQTIEKQHNKLQLLSQDLEKEKLLLITESEQHNKQRNMLETNLHDCQNRLSELERENMDLSSKLKNSLGHIEILNGQLDFVQKEKEKSEHEIKACNALISDLKMQVFLLEEEGNDLRTKMQEETEKQEKAHVEIGRLQQLLDQMQERNIELSDERRQHIGELTTVKEKVTDLERDIQTQKMENVSLANNLSLGVKFKDQLKVRTDSLKNLLAVPDIGAGQGEDGEGMQLFDAIIEKVKIMQTDLSCVEEANKRLSNVASAMSTYVEQLKSDMSVLQSEKKSVEEDVVIRSQHSENLQKELFMVQDVAENLRIQLQATKEREGNLEEEAKKLQHSLERSENSKMILQNEYQRTLYNYNSVKTQVAELQCRFCVVEQESQTFLTEVLTQISLMTILESNIAERNEQIQQLLVLFKRLDKEKKELEDEVQTGFRKFQMLEAEVEHLQEVVQKFEEEKRRADALQNELKLLNEKSEQMGLQLELQSHLNKEKDTILADVRQRLQAVEEENITLVKDVENMKEEHAAGEMTLKNLRLQVSSTSEEIVYLRQAESNLEEDVKNLQHSLLSSHDAHLLLQDEHQRTLQDYNSVRTEIDELKGRFCAVEQENTMFLTEALTQMNLLTVLKSNAVQKDEQVQQLLEQLNKSHTEKVELESKVQIGAGKLQMLEVEVQKLQELIQRFKEEKSIADTLQNEFKLLNIKFEQMNLQLQSGFYLLKEKDKMLCELREQLQSVDEEKKKMLKDLGSAQQKHAISEMAANEFWLQVSSLTEENIHLRQELSAVEKDRAKVKEELHDSCKEREILSMKVTSSAIKEEELQNDIKQLQEEREDLRCQLQKQTDQATMLELEVEGLHETLKFKEIHNVLLKDGNQKIYDTCKLLGTQTQDLKEKIISMEQEKKKQGAEAEARVAQVKELERTIADLETGKHNARARATTILSLTAPLKDDLYGLKEQVLGQMTVLKMDNCKLQDNMLKCVKDAMNKLQETNMEQSLEVQSQAHEVQKLQAEIKCIVTEQEKKNQTLEDEYHRVIEENHDVKAKLEDVLNVKIHLESENSSLKMELNEHIQKAAQLEERRETIGDELHFQVKEGENLKAQLEETNELGMHILKLLEFVIGPDPNQVSLNVESCQFAKNKLKEIHEEMFCLKHENKKLKEDTLHMSCQIDKLKAALNSKYKEGIIDGRVRSHRLSRNSQRKTQQIETENWTPDGEIPREPKNKYLTLEIGSKREDGVFGKERTFLEKPKIQVADSHVCKDKGLLQMQESVHGPKVSKNDPNNDALDKSELFKEKYTNLGNPVQELSCKAKKLDAKFQAEQDLAMKLKQLQPELVDTQILKERIEELQAHVKSLQLENIQFKELSDSKEADLVEVESLMVQEEKEVVVDEAKGPENTNDVIQEIDMFQEENKKNWGRLDFVTKKIQSLQNAIQELQRRSKSLKQKNKSMKDDRWWKGLDYNSLEKQLRELQGQAKQLSEHNNRLRKDVKYVFACMNRIQEDISGQENKFDEETLRACQQNSKIAERLDSSSEKARVLELEVQRIRLTLSRFQQQILEDGPKIKVPLRAFLVGGRKEPPLKQKACCACMHPSTRD